MLGHDHLLLKLVRMVLTMTVFAVVTAFLLLGAVPEITKTATVVGSVLVATVVAMYDFGLFSSELEV
ncbi:MAG: hypothetical protein C0617_08240 [Desulfuromonas sp.]|uniref:hypothetical protein n=1 Tax=Desulfuromonas sp. TaxID=892 RepID=UPI000CC1467C|nr:hypothetical protein [Desulfuromonas sp.]PLX84358.1 MAG: hypothetical protein C0617_08240 [Desulfuromonas sp.]